MGKPAWAETERVQRATGIKDHRFRNGDLAAVTVNHCAVPMVLLDVL